MTTLAKVVIGRIDKRRGCGKLCEIDKRGAGNKRGVEN